jgi:hypothetical protein
VEGTEEEQSWPEEDVPAEAPAAEEGAGSEAVLIGPCVGVFEASPGNCRAVWGLVEGTAFIAPGACVTVPRLPDDRMDEVGTLNGSETLFSVKRPAFH